MTIRKTVRHVRFAIGAAVGFATLAVCSALPTAAAPAPDNCGQPNFSIGVAYLSLQSATNVTMMAQLDGSYARDVTARVFCTDDTGKDIGEVTGSQIKVWVDSTKDIRVNGAQATSASPAILSAPDGFVTFTISSTDPNLLNTASGEWRALVGRDTSLIAVAFGTTVGANETPGQWGNIWAQTPELDSLALFGTGALGMAGYGLTRLRAARGTRSTD